ncbi:MAG: hypothetical protein U9N76_04640 [Candidatus Marinimicrobia bacterium]|nr:hypothetical protein [Candidatus Neomarinimicrobiota bacterium]
MVKVNLLDSENMENSNTNEKEKLNNTNPTKKEEKPYNNEYFFGFDENNDEEDKNKTILDSKSKEKKSKLWVLIILLAIIFSTFFYLTYTDVVNDFLSKSKTYISQHFAKTKLIISSSKRDVNSFVINDSLKKDTTEVQNYSQIHIEKKIGNNDRKITHNKSPQKQVSYKQSKNKIGNYKNLKNQLQQSDRRVKQTAKLLKHTTNGLYYKNLIAKNNSVSFELFSKKNDLIDRYYSLLRSDRNFDNIRFKSVDRRFRFSMHGKFTVTFSNQRYTNQNKLKNIDVNNFIDYVRLYSNQANIRLEKINKISSKIISSPSMKKSEMSIVFDGNIYQIRLLLNNLTNIPGSFDVKKIEMKNTYNNSYKLILNIILFEKV